MTKRFKTSLITATLAMAAFNSNAAVEIYNNDGITFSTDGLVNVFYSNSSIDKTDATGVETDRTQSRVRTGFLPSNIGFNIAKQLDDVKIAMRSSFWVSLSDTDNVRDESPADLGTGSLIDVRQFYATISGDFGEVLIGKDFGLYNRANILGDELLLGFGQTSDFFGLADGNNVSFGNIATGYTYPMPKSQITYRTPDLNGFQLAVAIMDPNKLGADSSEDLPRFEAELMYSTNFNNDSSLKAWVSGVTQSSEINDVEHDQTGIGYGINYKISGLSLTASGYSAEGLGHVAGLDQIVGPDTVETEGYLIQAAYTLNDNRIVLTYGESETSNSGNVETVGIVGDATHSNTGIAYFRTILPGLTAVVEYNNTEADATDSLIAEDNNTFSIGAVVTF
ncbi:porin [Colwellia sp. 4_MG-2023]|uniref:porin n=1 Tax=unclassified Colwellia TaxID=196834 RepID=UPI001C08D115|nr:MULTISPECIES: porin [unclassified Colwellia]MBU2924523.1 porin [Colwellia sp. C2M11]MDO6487608.1 porin [Colwellia sp. 6_MG-2023]MDO6507337.1 porin [Colwellia sp. 5_MG-2023]MDO6556070.1 porin [Colwellia sp. 4_MG-2023]MDO6652934.1 porin [Colwellia sp. 3_MG-2023]